MKKNLLPLFLLLCITITGTAQPRDTTKTPNLVLELPLVDFPYQFDAIRTVDKGNAPFGGFFNVYSNPSMHQSLNVSTDLYTAAHYGIQKLFGMDSKTHSNRKRPFLYSLTLCTSDFILMFAPGFNGWEHEEYHRAMLSRFHVNSFDEMNKFPLGSETVSVDNITDEDLTRFKRESPTDFIRTHVAGIEGEYLLVDKLQRNNFYYDQNLPHEIFYLFTTLNSILYVQACSDPNMINQETDNFNTLENTIKERDFTGFDFSGWVYDLFRPNESYSVRGIHPSGTGINRYIKTTNLTPEELSYLKKQGALQWFNALSPMLFGIRQIKLSYNGLYGNISIHHYLTSFGNDISCNVFLKNAKYNAFFACHSYQNYNRSYPAIEMQFIDICKPIGSTKFYFSPRCLLGWQPSLQAFKTTHAAFLGLLECKLEIESYKIFHPFVEISAKTKGWIAGNEFLNENIGCRLGVVARFEK